MASLCLVGGGAYPARVAHKDLMGQPISNIPTLGTEPMILNIGWRKVKSVEQLKAVLDEMEAVLKDRRVYPDLDR